MAVAQSCVTSPAGGLPARPPLVPPSASAPPSSSSSSLSSAAASAARVTSPASPRGIAAEQPGGKSPAAASRSGSTRSGPRGPPACGARAALRLTSLFAVERVIRIARSDHWAAECTHAAAVHACMDSGSLAEHSESHETKLFDSAVAGFRSGYLEGLPAGQLDWIAAELQEPTKGRGHRSGDPERPSSGIREQVKGDTFLDQTGPRRHMGDSAEEGPQNETSITWCSRASTRAAVRAARGAAPAG